MMHNPTTGGTLEGFAETFADHLWTECAGVHEPENEAMKAITDYIEAAEHLRAKIDDPLARTDDFWISDAKDSYDKKAALLRAALIAGVDR